MLLCHICKHFEVQFVCIYSELDSPWTELVKMIGGAFFRNIWDYFDPVKYEEIGKVLHTMNSAMCELDPFISCLV